MPNEKRPTLHIPSNLQIMLGIDAVREIPPEPWTCTRVKAERPDVTVIDEIYGQLAVLAAKRNSNETDSGLEGQITQLFKRLEQFQKQESELIRALFLLSPTGAIATGVAILESADELRAKYGNIR